MRTLHIYVIDPHRYLTYICKTLTHLTLILIILSLGPHRYLRYLWGPYIYTLPKDKIMRIKVRWVSVSGRTWELWCTSCFIIYDITCWSLTAVLENHSSTAGLSCAMTNLLYDMTHSDGCASCSETNSYNEFVVWYDITNSLCDMTRSYGRDRDPSELKTALCEQHPPIHNHTHTYTHTYAYIPTLTLNRDVSRRDELRLFFKTVEMCSLSPSLSVLLSHTHTCTVTHCPMGRFCTFLIMKISPTTSRALSLLLSL